MKYKFKTVPRPHQRRALVHLLRTTKEKPALGGGLQVKMRYGKSKIAVDFACAVNLKHGWRRVLVVTVISGLGVWERELTKHCPRPWVLVDRAGEVIASGLGLKMYDDAEPLIFRVVNFESTYDRVYYDGRAWVPQEPAADLEHFAPEVVIVDEGHHIGNPQTSAFKSIHRLGLTARCRVIMSGTSFHRKPFYVFGQAKFYDDGASLGSSFDQFKRRIAVFGGAGGYEVLYYQDLDWMMDSIKPWMFIGEELPTLAPVINVLPFHLTGRNLDLYARMEEHSIVRLPNGTEVTADFPMTRHLKLQMMASGWIKDEDGRYHRIGRAKRDFVRDRFRMYKDNDIFKVVVGCRFLPELRDARDLARAAGFVPYVLHGKVKKGAARDRLVDGFQTTKKPAMFVTQVKAAREAIDLSAADTMMHYGLSESYVDHDQFSNRIYLYGLDRTLMHDFPLAVGTRDEVTYEALTLKKDVADLLAHDPEKVMEITNRLKRGR